MKQLFVFLLLSATCFSQQTRFVDFISVDGSVTPDADSKTVSGAAIYNFIVMKRIDTIKIDAVDMTFSDVMINGKRVKSFNSGKQLQLFEGFKKGKNIVSFSYKASPKQTIYFVGNGENSQIWTQGQGKYTSYWFPSFDDVNEKVIFRMRIITDKKWDVISNGTFSYSDPVKGNHSTFNGNGTDKISYFTMEKPMSSYLLMLAIGKFGHQEEKSSSGIPLQYYYAPEDSAKYESTYRYSKRIFDFMEKEIGVPYPWKIYRQIPVHDFIYGGMENTTSTLFNEVYVVDEIGFNDNNYINVNGHELAHQWFGDMVTAKSSKHHWLQEGFATYYALLAEKEVFGEDHFNFQLYDIAEQLQQASKTDTIPILNEKASSLSFYQKGAWALHVLRENVGAEKFRKAVKNYLEKYQFKNVDTGEFLAEINKVSDYDTNDFRKRWLESSVFPIQEALAILKKSNFIREYFRVAEMKDIPLAQKQTGFENLLASNAFYPIKQEIVNQLQELSFEEKKDMLHKAMQTNDVFVRQAVAGNFDKVPEGFKTEYETLLDDKSYFTREIALNRLWSQFPEDRNRLLDKSADWVGLIDKNLRIMWLSMALKTKDYRQDKKPAYYDELLQYASPDFRVNTRINALDKLIFLDKSDKNYLPFLVNGLVSHIARFSKFSRDKIRTQLKNQSHREYYESLLESLSEKEKIQLDKLLKEK
ncbi:M1 family metallopeptidase [Flavobacterium pallidum]|uniref:Aminopeptidase N n=1 Tax=Flavobacterium pallidum TaxID=2172098 RepID=A0A2S1SIG1_9FLAO|nr:M1 family metallopeptidase [Flavobacterium pallidum]AWI26180.1 aminopeptidase [Flavobacterium pallidum]